MRKLPNYKTVAKTNKQTLAREVWAKRIQDQWDALESRKNESASRSPQEQLKILDERFGKDVGAKRERAKLIKKIEENKEK